MSLNYANFKTNVFVTLSLTLLRLTSQTELHITKRMAWGLSWRTCIHSTYGRMDKVIYRLCFSQKNYVYDYMIHCACIYMCIYIFIYILYIYFVCVCFFKEQNGYNASTINTVQFTVFDPFIYNPKGSDLSPKFKRFFLRDVPEKQ